MKRLFFAAFLLSGLTYSHVSSASIWSWIDTIQSTNCSLTYCYQYTFIIQDWDENDTTPNPCYGLTSCTIFIGHRHQSNGTSGGTINRSFGSGTYPAIITAETMGQLGAAVKSFFQLPYSGITNHQSDSVTATEECVGFFYLPGQSITNNSETTNSTAFSRREMLPGAICGAAPPPSGSCDFIQDSVTLDHGTLSRKELEGHEATEQVNITCTTSQSLKLYIYAADKVQLRDDGSLYSELYMNNTTLGTDGFTLDVEENAVVDIKSTLRTNGTPEAGEFSGSTVMLITVE